MTSVLRQKTEAGARTRYTGANGMPTYERAQPQLERELRLIEKLRLEGYFLIVGDIVDYCREEKILIQGRGSAANSAVCYALGITAIDPIGMELLFERFLSEERGEWPDIDLDLPSGEQREKAIQYVYNRYGKLGAAMTANVITYRGRSAAREVGKVLGFDDDTLGRLAGLVHTWEWKDPKDSSERQFRDAGLDLQNPRIRKFFQLYEMVQDLPRHLGQHSGYQKVFSALRNGPGSATPPGTALRRHGDLSGTTRRDRAARTSHDAGTRGRAMGQRRLCGSRINQSRFARAGNDGGARRFHSTHSRCVSRRS
jgi:error-prone DNA polymerase